MGRLLSDTGVELASIPLVAYSYNNGYFSNGYNYNTFSVYLGAGSTIPWNSTNNTIVLDGSPTLNWLGTTAITALSGAVDNASADNTLAANNVTANDMPLPAALNETYYFGSVYDFNKITVNIGTPGVGIYTTTWEYWDGSGWSVLTGVTDATAYFMAPAGNHDVTFTIPVDWTATTVAPVAGSMMWVRARINSFTSLATPPLGTQAWVNGNSTYPTISAPSTTFIWNTSASIAITQNFIYSQMITWMDTLGGYWSLALTQITGSGKVLSSYGQTYLTQVISNLQQICPKLFITSASVPKYVDKTHSVAAAGTVESTWPLNWSGISSYLGFTGTDMIFRTLIALIGIFFIVSYVGIKVPYAIVPTAWGLLVGFASVGWVSPVLAAGLAFMALVVFSLVFILGKAIT
jgi:hypothetical protein